MKRNWYKAKVKYAKEVDGVRKKVSAEFLVDAQSFTETEKRMLKSSSDLLDTRDIDINAIAIESVTDILDNGDEDSKWYKAVVPLMVEDDSGKIKATPQNIYVRAEDTKDADAKVREHMQSSMIDWEIKSITETKVVAVLKYSDK